jgi:hypothetical protein
MEEVKITKSEMSLITMKKLKSFVKKELEKLVSESSAFISSSAQRALGIDLLSNVELSTLPSFARFMREARKAGIDVDSFEGTDIFQVPGVIKYVKARRVYDILEGRDATSYDITILEGILDRIDGKI